MVSNLKLLIKENFKAFISIMLLTVLGVGFLVGMKSAVPNLKYTVNSYFDKYNVFDLRLSSSIGFTSEDINEFKSINGIKNIEGSYEKDFIVKGNSEDYVLRVHSYNNKIDSINQLEIIYGKVPQNENEIAIEYQLYKSQHYELKDKIILDSDLLNNKELTIVGVIKSPLYLSNNKGSTNLLSGRVNYYAYISTDNINSEVFNYIYIKADKDNIDSVSKNIKTLGSFILDKKYTDIINELKEKITKGQNEIDAKKKEAENKIKEYEQEIANGNLQILSAEKSIPSLEEAKIILKNKQNELNKVKNELDSARNKINDAKNKYNKAKTEFDNVYKLYDELKNKIDTDNDYLAIIEESLNYAKKQLNNAKEELDTKQREYDAAYSEYEKVYNALNASSAEEIIELAKKEVNEKRALLNQKKLELEQNKIKVAEDFKNYQNQLNDAKDYLKLISVNGWRLDRRENISSYSQYLSDINRIEKISNFFPIIFYIVAVLITITNISRIITNKRDKIGLYKALGYSNSYIKNGYILFSLLACIIGSCIGIVVGTLLIPRIFYSVYKIIYFLPKIKYILNYKMIMFATLLAILLVILSTYFSINKTIKECPAKLFRPKENNKGKRVFLEKIPFVWDKVNFTNKVTFRNMFKYPSRFIMIILGIAGCISLITTGFNIKTSISNIIPLQYEKLFDIDAEIFFKDSLTRSEIQNEKERISNYNEIDSTILTYIKYVYINNTEIKANLVVPEDSDLLLDFVSLKDNNKKYELSDSGVIITKKMSEIFNIKVNDDISLKDMENNIFNVKVSAIVNNYIDNYLYMSNNYYATLLNETPKYNAVLVRTKNNNYKEEELSDKFNENNTISYLVYTSTSKIMYETLTKSLNYIVYILVISAVMLAFIVLYNLNSLNVEERKREIATIEVLGFYSKETYRYIENEIRNLTLIGIIIGIFLGYFFSNILIKNCELDNLMYDYNINYYNYIYSILITIIFMVLTSLLGRVNIKRINMIESLKKVE